MENGIIIKKKRKKKISPTKKYSWIHCNRIRVIPIRASQLQHPLCSYCFEEIPPNPLRLKLVILIHAIIHPSSTPTFSPFPKKGTELDIARATSGKRGREERDGEGGKSRKVDIIRSDDWRASPKSRWRTGVSVMFAIV